MATHKANPVEVSAFRFSGQKLYELPEWVADHSVMTSMGMSGMALDGVGNLLVPTASGYKTAVHGDYVVLDQRGRASILKTGDFEQAYSPLTTAED